VLSFEFIYTSLLIVLMTVFLIREWLEPDLIVFSVLVLLTIGGVINLAEAFSGFSNPGMLTVALLFIIAAALQNTGILNRIGDFLSRSTSKLSKKLFQFLLPVSVISAFFNNTPVVAMFIPAVRQWSKKADIPVSKLMIPLSYASIVGGTCTLIGTSTTLVVHGLMLENGIKGLGFFEISKISAPIAVLALIVICLVGYRILPNRREPIVKLDENSREYVIEMTVQTDFQYIGQTIEKAGMRQLKGLYLFQIEREGELITNVNPKERIQLNDRLFFTGLPETVLELQRTPGLSVIKDSSFNLKNYDSDNMGTFEAVISANSPLIGQNVRNSQFRTRYDAVILAIHRSGERITKKIGDIVLHSGDTLLLLAKQNFVKKWYHSKDFYLVSRAPLIPSKPKWHVYFSLIVLVLMIITMATGLVPILIAVSAAALLLLIFRTISTEDARKSIDLGVVLIIASAFGIAKALDNSGVADYVASGILNLLSSLGNIGILAGVYFITSIYTEIITNNAAAALMFPIILSISQQASIDPRPFFIALAIAASASFATPIGYQTNLMVYGPGGYKFTDFLKVGIPMNLMIGVLAIGFITFFYF